VTPRQVTMISISHAVHPGAEWTIMQKASPRNGGLIASVDQCDTVTGVPTLTFSKNFSAMNPGIRMQPWLAA